MLFYLQSTPLAGVAPDSFRGTGPAARVAPTYVECVEGNRNGETLDARRFAWQDLAVREAGSYFFFTQALAAFDQS
jgi:hypothetical protein